MSKKRGKSATASASESKCEVALASAPWNEEAWWGNIALVVSNRPDDEAFIKYLNQAIGTGQRRLFTFVTRDEIYKYINDLGNPKNKKGKEVPPNFEICENAKVYLDAGDEVPLKVLAKVIKWRLLTIKAEDQKRRESDKKGGDGGKGGKKGAEKGGKERGKSAKGKGGGGKKTPEPPSVKGDTKLRKRGEEDPDALYINDEPDDGAMKYVVISGFMQPHLLRYMAEIGIGPDVVVRMKSQKYESKFNFENEEDKPANLEELVTEYFNNKQVIDTFWRDVPLIQKDNKCLRNIIVQPYEVQQLLIPEESDDAEKKNEFAMLLFEDVACMLYDILDVVRQWKDYHANMQLIPVPMFEVGVDVDADGAAEEISDQVDMRLYNNVLNRIPEESVSVELILSSMLDQIEASESSDTPQSQEQVVKRSDGLDAELAGYFSNMSSKLALSEEEIRLMQDDFHTKKSVPIGTNSLRLLHPSDNIQFRLAHMDFESVVPNPMDTEQNILLNTPPYCNFIQLPLFQLDILRKRKARLQEFLFFLSKHGHTANDIDRTLKQLVFECMQTTSCDVSGYILPARNESLENSVVIWDDPYPFFCGLKDLLEEPEEHEAIQRTASIAGSNSNSPTPRSSRPGSATGSGILKRSNSSSPERQSSSVHFEQVAIDKSFKDSPPVLSEDLSNDAVMEKFASLSKCCLDEFCFAETFNHSVMLQILKEATHRNPYIDTYYHKRDHCLLMVVHNPQSPEVLSNHIQWHDWLHSNTGFNHHFHYVKDEISSWTVEREAIYQATMLNTEVEQDFKDEEDAKKKAEVEAKKGARGKSPPKKGSARARSRSDSRPNSAERPITNEVYVMENSLKAQKMEADRIQREKDEEEQKKADKRSRSAQKKAAEKEEKKRPGSKSGSAKSKKSPRSASAGAADVSKTELVVEEPSTPEPFWPFVGYDLGDTLVHVSGDISTMFPTDGGTIRAERTDFVDGGTMVRTSVLKDGHVFAIHVVDPITEVMARFHGNADVEEVVEEEIVEGEEGGETEQVQRAGEKVPTSYFGSFTANMNDGLSLALSAYGPEGVPEDVHPPEPQPYIPPAARPSSQEPPSPSRGKKGKEKTPLAPVEQDKLEEENVEVETSELRPFIHQNFQKLFVSCPNGQTLSFMLESQCGANPESEDDRRLLMKMSHVGKSASSLKNDSNEMSRLVTMDGTVVKSGVDGSTTVLHPDGTVVVGRMVGVRKTATVETSRPGRTAGKLTTAGKSTKSAKSKVETESEPQEESFIQWTTYHPSGQITRDGQPQTESLKVSMATDPSSGQVMYTREDNTTMIVWTDAEASITEHADGTRITQFAVYQELEAQDLQVDVETGEGGGGSPVFDLHEFSRVECPGLPTLLLNRSTGEAEATLGGVAGRSVLAASPNGMYHLQHADGGQVSVHDDGTVLYTPRAALEVAHLHPEGVSTYSMRHHADIVCEVVDPEGNVFSVDVSGNSNVMMSSAAEEEAAKPAAEATSPPSFGEHAPRLFVVHGNGTGMELLRYQDIAEYLAAAERDPESAVIKSELQDCSQGSSISVLRPLKKNLSELWNIPYLQESIVPKGLSSRDLKTIPPTEFKKPGPRFGTNVGKGVAVGAALKEPKSTDLPTVPSVMEFRQFYQMKPVSQAQRTFMKTHLLEYAEFVQTRLQTEMSVQLDEPRAAEEVELANQLVQDFQRLLTHAPDMYVEATAPPPPPKPPTPVPKRKPEDWERDRREKEGENENRTALRKKVVPNYFLSEFGKDFLLDQAIDIDTLARKLGVFPNSAASTRPNSVTAAAQSAREAAAACTGDSAQPCSKPAPAAHRTPPAPPPPPPPHQEGAPAPVYYDTRVPPEFLEKPRGNPPDSLTKGLRGSPRRTPVRLPAYLSSGRPGVAGNPRQTCIEDDVRRRVLTTSVIGGPINGQLNLRKMRGINCLPNRVDFGLLREGYTYRMKLHLINTGPETCRWKVPPPPPATGLRLLYQPGALPAGLRTVLNVEIYAIAVGVEGESGVGELQHDLHICTETDLLVIPVSGRIMTAEQYDQQKHVQPSSGVQLVATRPNHTRDFLIRGGRRAVCADADSV